MNHSELLHERIRDMNLSMYSRTIPFKGVDSYIDLIRDLRNIFRS